MNGDGEQVLSPKQSEVCRVPRFRGDPTNSSLLFETDLIHKKSRTDVIVHGHAYAQDGSQATMIAVRLRVGSIDKTLSVYGDRIIEGGFVGVTASHPLPFTRMPITYERSFGGTDQQDENPKRHACESSNPVGVGFGTAMKHVNGRPAPNIEYPNSPYRGFDHGRPAGFGPIARHWTPRSKFAGTYDGRWEKERMPLLPSDFEERFYQCAPEDQQTNGFLRGGELVELFNMTPGGYLSFEVPRIRFSFSTQLGIERVEHRANLHTVIIEPDIPLVTLVWHSSLSCHGREHSLHKTVIRRKRNISLSGEDRDA